MIPIHAEEMKRAMGKDVRQTGAKVFDRRLAIKIVTENGRVAGVLGFNKYLDKSFPVFSRPCYFINQASAPENIWSSTYTNREVFLFQNQSRIYNRRLRRQNRYSQLRLSIKRLRISKVRFAKRWKFLSCLLNVNVDFRPIW